MSRSAALRTGKADALLSQWSYLPVVSPGLEEAARSGHNSQIAQTVQGS